MSIELPQPLEPDESHDVEGPRIDISATLAAITAHSRSTFAENRLICSFAEYLSQFAAMPLTHSRSAAQYVVDMVTHFGVSVADGIDGPGPHYHLFDGFAGSERSPVIGQGTVIDEIMSVLRSFALAARADKLVLLHGPNGSSKSTILASIMDGLERYSYTDGGSIHRFSWIFPSHDETAISVGFVAGSASAPQDDLGRDSYAYLQPDDVASRVTCELKDSPILLLPHDARKEFCERVIAGAPEDAAEDLRNRLLSPEALRSDLCPKCKTIQEALLSAYHGDLDRVLRHVQVERFYFSKRFRTGSVVVEPQMQNIDAWARQITADHSLAYLPAALANLRLFEAGGDLVDANRGVLEYSDLLKRPRDAFKYLLVTSEQGTINLPSFIAYLDLVLTATVNELHLDEFKNLEHNPDYVSFKARMEFVTVPYLLRVGDEERVYRELLTPIVRGVHVAPHTIELAALWAVLTRLRKPDQSFHEGALAHLIPRIDPLSKAQLYGGLPVGERFRPEEIRLLRSSISQVRREFAKGDNYEGRFGVSAREMKTAIQEAVQRSDHGCVTPLDVIDCLKELCTRKSTHLFLRIPKEEDGYRDTDAHIAVIEEEYLRFLSREVKSAMGLVSEEECDRHFDEYVEHVIAYTTGRKVKNDITGASEPPDKDLMRRLEEVFEIKETPDLFRRKFGSRLGAFALEHPSQKPAYGEVFPELMDKLKADVYERKKDIIQRVERGMLVYGHDEFDDLPPRDQERVKATLGELCSRFGYCEHCARIATSHLIKHEIKSGPKSGPSKQPAPPD